MYNNDSKNKNKLSFLRENFSFLNEDKLSKTYTLMNEGFNINLAIILCNFDINSSTIKDLRKERKQELKENTKNLIGDEKLKAIDDFSLDKWDNGGDKKLARYYSKQWDKKRIREAEKMKREPIDNVIL